MESEVDSSVIIVTWNSEKFITNCLESIYRKSDNIQLEIIVVDNGSTDETVAAIKRTFSCVDVIETGSNLGFPKAVNRGIRHSRGRYLFLLNPDTRLESNVIGILSKFLDAHDHVSAAGPKIIEKDGTINFFSARRLPSLSGCISLHFGLRKAFPQNRVFSRETIPDWDRSSCRSVPYLNGAALMLRRSSEGKAIYLDEQLPMYYEDLELSARISTEGNLLFYIPDAVVTHLGSKSSEQFPARSWLYALENGHAPWYYILNFKGKMAAIVFGATLLVANTFRVSVLWLPYVLCRCLSQRKAGLISVWLKKASALVVWCLSDKKRFRQKALRYFS